MRHRASSVLLVAGLLALAPLGFARAQEEGERDQTGERELRIERGGDRLMRIVLNRKARLGIKVNLEARETDSIGAYVDAVTPGGPAAKAGIRSGDIITSVGGTSVLSRGAASDRGDGRSLPGLRLIELAAQLEPNDTVEVEYRRGGERHAASVVTEDERDFVFEGGPGSRPFTMRYFRRGPGDVRLPAAEFLEEMGTSPAYREFFSGSPLARLELAPMNEELGRYFGTSEGVLVISAPADAGLGLRGGDVVLAVDGRKPMGPGHLLRILRSYERGETFKVDVLRQRKRETVTARLGEREE